jgi:flagellar P-ring protein precursor FlgI
VNRSFSTTALFALLLLPLLAHGDRIKDLAEVAGVRSNHLLGYGLVVGLDGSGDQTTQTPYTAQTLRSMLANLGISVPSNVRLRPKNVAAVSISADLPPFAKPGQRIDITVSSLGNAKSLRGGTLLMAPLQGVDGQVYAMAQGSVLVGGLGAEGDASRVVVNVPSAGRIPGGATVERSVSSPFDHATELVLNLHSPDFTTAQRVADAINTQFGQGVASPLDAASVKIQNVRFRAQRVGFVAALESIEVEPGEAPARIIVNSRTGTVVINQKVRVRPAAVSHGNLTVSISERPVASQPNPFAQGETQVLPRTTVNVEEDAAPMFLFGPGVTLREIVNAINRVGTTPSDLVAILEALKSAGALGAELIII